MAMEAFSQQKGRTVPRSISRRVYSVLMEQITSVASYLIFSIASKCKLLWTWNFGLKIGFMGLHLIYSMPNNSEVQLPTLSAIGSQARKSLMSIASSIVRCTADLLCAARALPIHHSLPVICKSHVVSYLLPFVVANIGVVAESDPKVKLILLSYCDARSS